MEENDALARANLERDMAILLAERDAPLTADQAWGRKIAQLSTGQVTALIVIGGFLVFSFLLAFMVFLAQLPPVTR